MKRNLRRHRLSALLIGAALLLDYPLLALWDRDAMIGGLPLFPLALFALWAALIALTAWLVHSVDD
mgnify:CR=1 FL=1